MHNKSQMMIKLFKKVSTFGIKDTQSFQQKSKFTPYYYLKIYLFQEMFHTYYLKPLSSLSLSFYCQCFTFKDFTCKYLILFTLLTLLLLLFGIRFLIFNVEI